MFGLYGDNEGISLDQINNFDDCKFQVFAENLFYDLRDYTETKYVVLGH